ncbi:hypothetical protein [Streptomyces hebeiensis]
MPDTTTPNTSPLDRLLAEAIPTGTFGDAQPARPRQRERRRWTTAEQARHVAELEAELDLYDGRGTGKPQRHLRAVSEAA